MNKSRSILIALLLIPFAALGQDTAEQTSLDQLLDQYKTKQQVANASAPENLEAENRRLKNQIIDLRVDLDAANDMISYLETIIANHEADEEGIQAECHNVECVPLEDVMNEKLLTYVITSLGMYRLAEIIDQTAPVDNIEAHTKAQKIMNGVKRDLDSLGFDTSDMTEIPTLDQLLEELEITQGSRLAR